MPLTHTSPQAGKVGQINFLSGVIGYANAQCMLDDSRAIGVRLLQARDSNTYPLVTGYLPGIGHDVVTSLYVAFPLPCFLLLWHCTDTATQLPPSTQHDPRHNKLRCGPFISIHGGFPGTASSAGFPPTSDRIIPHTHPHLAFDGAPNDSPIATSTDPLEAGGIWPKRSERVRRHDRGQFINGYNDCELYLSVVHGTQHYGDIGGDCSLSQDATTWNDTTKAGPKQFCAHVHGYDARLSLLDEEGASLRWNIAQYSDDDVPIAPALDSVVRSSLWSYRLGLQNGVMPADPRDSNRHRRTDGETIVATVVAVCTGTPAR
ncbi:hypothetical protein B0H14DRAFT_3655771 [Mycena olivaceomarginata]|nr:hypothetical protein B0H14DRAFT_3655771 [Mycena olivaceomarginata]